MDFGANSGKIFFDNLTYAQVGVKLNQITPAGSSIVT